MLLLSLYTPLESYVTREEGAHPPRGARPPASPARHRAPRGAGGAEPAQINQSAGCRGTGQAGSAGRTPAHRTAPLRTAPPGPAPRGAGGGCPLAGGRRPRGRAAGRGEGAAGSAAAEPLLVGGEAKLPGPPAPRSQLPPHGPAALGRRRPPRYHPPHHHHRPPRGRGQRVPGPADAPFARSWRVLAVPPRGEAARKPGPSGRAPGSPRPAPRPQPRRPSAPAAPGSSSRLLRPRGSRACAGSRPGRSEGPGRRTCSRAVGAFLGLLFRQTPIPRGVAWTAPHKTLQLPGRRA